MQAETHQQNIDMHTIITNPVDTAIIPCSPFGINIPTVLWVGSKANIKKHDTMLKLIDVWQGRFHKLSVSWKMIYKDSNDTSRAQVIQACQQASVIISTSYAEGCSNFLLEALASNTPIIVTKTGLFWNWWNSKLGQRVDVYDDIDQFINALRFVLDNLDTFYPRQTSLNHGLGYDKWAKTWNDLIQKVYNDSQN
jgi:glycosyltransferase involved in cell wall biosynthesis